MGTWKINLSMVKAWGQNLLYLAYPDLCLVCGTALTASEQLVCHACLYQLPKMTCDYREVNEVASLFYGKLPFEKAASGLRYLKESPIQDLMEQLKYKGQKKLGPMLGAFASMPLQRSGFFNDIDVLVPVPLHPAKERRRGYNQSAFIAEGVSKTSGLPVCSTALKRLADTKTQTRKNLYERWQNVDTLFDLSDTTRLEYKHVLLIDDVLTSGSTLEACGKAVLKAKGAKVSFFTLCRA